jgi:hypothetical protein
MKPYSVDWWWVQFEMASLHSVTLGKNRSVCDTEPLPIGFGNELKLKYWRPNANPNIHNRHHPNHTRCATVQGDADVDGAETETNGN